MTILLIKWVSDDSINDKWVSNYNITQNSAKLRRYYL